jgi:hypothetical protein
LVVRDKAGVRKRVLRTEDDTVFWEYAGGNSNAERAEEHSTPFGEFADTHFVVPQSRPGKGSDEVSDAAASQTGTIPGNDIRKDAIYADAQGRRVRVMEVGQKMVEWVELEQESGGVTPVSEFLKRYHPEGKAA